MYLIVTDYHGHQIGIDPKRVIKLRQASLSDEPANTVFVDYASNGTFVQEALEGIVGKFGAYIRLAALHAPNGQDIYINKDGVASVDADDRYAGNAVLIVTVEFENMRVPARNRIPVRETVAEAEAILSSAATV
ncbi:hypothetical protein [Bradyrhizobium ivorense]|uniref:hypothetical protein n=1 Tax=Bradyrhizobium ivorense TaxID=2511166 RepID=UPI0010B9C014|nr:hypothetical protein [Bradyrhizobium ivorense]VIO79237.1 hypothetical protein CI41S_68050 [Bradyrhizobium ivorense]